jgi:hypothetical protein
MSAFNDSEMRSRFDALRTGDASSAPDFHDLFERARRRPVRADRIGRRWVSRAAFSLAVAATIVLTVNIARESQRRRAFVPAPLSTWTSPTASLLRTPGTELIRSRALLSSMLDPVTSTTVSRRGKKQ